MYYGFKYGDVLVAKPSALSDIIDLCCLSASHGVVCLMTTAALYFGLYKHWTIALQYELIFKRFQIWRLFSNFFFLGPFLFPFAIRLIMIAKYGVSLEMGPFDKRTADYLWMLIFGALSLLVLAAIPYFWLPFMRASLVFMIVDVWYHEFPNAHINIYGVVSLKGFYLPWALLALDLIFGSPLMFDILGMVAGHVFYFLTVLHPLAGGKVILMTPLLGVFSHKFVAYWGEGTQVNSPVQRDPSAGVAFRGRGYHLGGRSAPNSGNSDHVETGNATNRQRRADLAAEGVSFGGRGYRLNGC